MIAIIHHIHSYTIMYCSNYSIYMYIIHIIGQTERMQGCKHLKTRGLMTSYLSSHQAATRCFIQLSWCACMFHQICHQRVAREIQRLFQDLFLLQCNGQRQGQFHGLGRQARTWGWRLIDHGSLDCLKLYHVSCKEFHDHHLQMSTVAIIDHQMSL